MLSALATKELSARILSGWKAKKSSICVPVNKLTDTGHEFIVQNPPIPDRLLDALRSISIVSASFLHQGLD
jgi:hypothetical protein